MFFFKLKLKFCHCRRFWSPAYKKFRIRKFSLGPKFLKISTHLYLLASCMATYQKSALSWDFIHQTKFYHRQHISTNFQWLSVNIVMGLLRPGFGSKFRKAFEWIHFVLGTSARLLAYLCIYWVFDWLQADAFIKPRDLVLMYVLFQCLSYMYFEVFRNKTVGKAVGNDGTVDKSELDKLNMAQFWLYVVLNVGFTALLIFYAWFYE